MKRPFYLLLLLSLLSSSYAQTLGFGLQVPTNYGLRPVVTVENLNAFGVRLELRAAGVVSGPLELGLGVRSNTTLGPLGNVIIEGRLDLDTALAFDLNVLARGTIGPVAGRASLSLFNVNPAHFRPQTLLTDTRTRYATERLEGGFGISLDLGLTYRLERTLILEAEPGITFLTGSGFGVRLSGGLRFAQLVERDDGTILLATALDPGFGSGYGAVGFEYRVNRPDWPILRGSVWLGGGSNGFAPGLRLLVGQTLADPGFVLNLELAAEPYRTDAVPYRVGLNVDVPLEVGALNFSVVSGFGGGSNVSPFTLSGRYSFRL